MKKLLLILALFSISIFLVGCGSSTSPTGNVVANTNSNMVKIPLSELSNSASFYEYDSAGTKVRYFAVLGSDNQVHTAFDACDVCGGSQGYVQVGSKMKCNKCGTSFEIDDIGTKNKPGGCWPSFLAHAIEDDFVLINGADLEQNKFRFV
ncbi:DUF2318 domain-containing protein [Candidatus Woesearchaeota archaeon]|jgi:uncharacterized membrane protein|nr:DUF2318 domain-containing protein [Candidatus Woesearchaeota archaeon]